MSLVAHVADHGLGGGVLPEMEDAGTVRMDHGVGGHFTDGKEQVLGASCGQTGSGDPVGDEVPDPGQIVIEDQGLSPRRRRR